MFIRSDEQGGCGPLDAQLVRSIEPIRNTKVTGIILLNLSSLFIVGLTIVFITIGDLRNNNPMIRHYVIC